MATCATDCQWLDEAADGLMVEAAVIATRVCELNQVTVHSGSTLGPRSHERRSGPLCQCSAQPGFNGRGGPIQPRALLVKRGSILATFYKGAASNGAVASLESEVSDLGIHD